METVPKAFERTATSVIYLDMVLGPPESSQMKNFAAIVSD